MKTSTALLLASLIAAPIAGCAHQGSDACDGFSAIYLSAGDQLTPETKKQLVKHNEYGEQACGWRPAK